QAEFDCLVALWNKESHWNVYAHNVRSGAYGIPQALPGDKMATVGADWATNPVTQITWGLGYISGRYGTPCGAWGHSQAKGWYCRWSARRSSAARAVFGYVRDRPRQRVCPR